MHTNTLNIDRGQYIFDLTLRCSIPHPTRTCPIPSQSIHSYPPGATSIWDEVFMQRVRRVEFGVWKPNSKLRSVFAINTTTFFHRSLLLHRIFSIWAGNRCLWKMVVVVGQTPQNLVKFQRFWVDDLGGEWCYFKNPKEQCLLWETWDENHELLALILWVFSDCVRQFSCPPT